MQFSVCFSSKFDRLYKQHKTVTPTNLRTEILVNFRIHNSFNWTYFSVLLCKFAFDCLLLVDNLYGKIQFVLHIANVILNILEIEYSKYKNNTSPLVFNKMYF